MTQSALLRPDDLFRHDEQLLDQVGRQVPQDKCDLVSRLLLELKLELRSLYFSLVAISDNEASATLLRTMEGIRHLLTSLAENAKGLEEEIGDPVMLAKCIVADDTAAQVSSRGVENLVCANTTQNGSKHAVQKIED